MRVFLDANILFAAALSPGGRVAALCQLAQAGFCSLLTSPHAQEEARRNLALKYPEKLGELKRLLVQVVLVPEAHPKRVAWAVGQGLPLKDAPILAGAVEARAALLVTGDRAHFGHLYGKVLEGVEVVPPAEALARVLERDR